MIREIERKAIQYHDYWVARVIQDEGTKKTCIDEKCFETLPTQQDIVEILLNSPSNCFVSVVHNCNPEDAKTFVF